MSDEINRHFAAALALSRSDFLRRLINEAELCIEFDQASAAAILAGIALEELSLFEDLRVVQTLEPRLEAWRELRNRAAHPAACGEEVDPKAVASMVTEIGALLDGIDRSYATPRSSPLSHDALTSIPGKYAFVLTSVDSFLLSKRAEVELENRK